MKTLVTPTDFSAISLNAVSYAADMAYVTGSDLCLIHVCPVPITLSEIPVPTNTIEEMVKAAEEKIKELKEKMLSKKGAWIKISTEVRQGNIVQEIADYCASVNTYAVVMGAESAGKIERFFSGGSTVSAVRQLSWPVIVVPAEVKFSSIRKIGLACDFRKVMDTIPFKEIRSLVNEFYAELHVLHVSTGSENTYSNATINESGWLQENIGDLKPQYHFITGTDIEKGISEFAETNKIDLLIVIPKKHNLLSKIFQHSHSERLVLQSHVPVMAIHE